MNIVVLFQSHRNSNSIAITFCGTLRLCENFLYKRLKCHEWMKLLNSRVYSLSISRQGNLFKILPFLVVQIVPGSDTLIKNIWEGQTARPSPWLTLSPVKQTFHKNQYASPWPFHEHNERAESSNKKKKINKKFCWIQTEVTKDVTSMTARWGKSHWQIASMKCQTYSPVLSSKQVYSACSSGWSIPDWKPVISSICSLCTKMKSSWDKEKRQFRGRRRDFMDNSNR